jgi:predicted transcriptional regulator
MPRDRKPAVAARLKDQRVPVSEIAKLLGVSGTTASTWAKEGICDREAS